VDNDTMSELFNVVFAGEVAGRADPAVVRANVGKLFGASDAVLDKLFSGQPVAIKKGVDRATAMQLRARMKQAGAEVRLVQVDEQGRPVAATAANPASVPASAPSAAASPVPASPAARPVAGAAPVAAAPGATAPAPAAEAAAAIAQASPGGSMAARLQALAREQAQESAARAASPAAAPAAAGNWDVKPVGTRLSDPLPPPPPAPDVSGMSLAAASGNLVSPQEIPRPAPVQVDVSGISMAAAGSEVLREEERQHVAPVQVDISALSMAEVGAPLDEIREEKPLVNPDISHISLA
jgi:hypothetical protein